MTYNFQSPFGSVPLNTDNLVGYGPEGAGAGNESLSEPKSVGRNVPDAIWLFPGKASVALSSNVKVVPVIGNPPPAPDMSNVSWPPDPTSRTSSSAGKGWLRLLNVTVT